MKQVDASYIILSAIAGFFKRLFIREECSYIFTKSSGVKHFCILKRGHRGAHQDIKL